MSFCQLRSFFLLFQLNTGILEGSLVFKIEDHKYMAALRSTNSSNFQFICGATILSNNKLLTTANCVHQARSVTLSVATLNTDEPYYSVEVSANEIIVHAEYDERTQSNNIAVIELERPLKFSPKIGSINMVDKTSMKSIKSGTNVLMLGYMESTDPNRDYGDTHLHSINAKISDFHACQSVYSGTATLVNGNQFCLHGNTYGKYIGGIRSLSK